MVKFDFNTYTNKFITEKEITEYDGKMSELKLYLNNHKNMMGWYNLDELENKKLIRDINETAKYIRDTCDVFLIVGIGGSYLGALSVIESLNPYFYNEFKKPQIYFVGTSLSSEYLEDLKELIKEKNIIVNFISKSGTTLEIAVAYKLIMDLMKEKYKEAALKDRVIITTGDSNSTLLDESLEYGYKLFNIPNNIGGRFSVLSTVGLLPIAVSGINISELFSGARDSQKDINNQIRYAVIRDIMSKKGKLVEAFVVYEPKLYALTEWLKQLYAESLGKEEKGILPIGIINTRDLHSLGQYIQEGSRILFETVININNNTKNIYVKEYNKTLNEMNNIASISSSIAHSNSGVLNNIIDVDKLDAYNVGYLLQFFMISCTISGFLSDVNAFDQNGVEEYKKIMKEKL